MDYNESTGLLSAEETPFRLLTSEDLVVTHDIVYRGVTLDPNLYVDVCYNTVLIEENRADLCGNVVRKDITTEQTMSGGLNTNKLRINDGNGSTSDADTAYFWYNNNYGGFTVNGQQLFSGTGNAINFFASAGAYFNGNLVFSGDNNDVVISADGADRKSLRLQAGDDNTSNTHYISLIARNGQKATYTAMRVDGLNERIDINKTLQINEDIEFNNTTVPSNTDKRLYMKTTENVIGSPPFQVITNTYDLMFQDKNITADLLQAEANIATNTSNIATNTSNIATNTSNISANTSAIATNTSNIATNTSNISANTSAIATNTSNISTIQSDYVSKSNTLTQTIQGYIVVNQSIYTKNETITDKINTEGRDTPTNDLLIYTLANNGNSSLTLGADWNNGGGNKTAWSLTNTSSDGVLRLNKSNATIQTGDAFTFSSNGMGINKINTGTHALDISGTIDCSGLYINGSPFNPSVNAFMLDDTSLQTAVGGLALPELRVVEGSNYIKMTANDFTNTGSIQYYDGAASTLYNMITFYTNPNKIELHEDVYFNAGILNLNTGGVNPIGLEIDASSPSVVYQSLQGFIIGGSSGNSKHIFKVYDDTLGSQKTALTIDGVNGEINVNYPLNISSFGITFQDPTNIGQAQVGTYGTSSYARFGHKDASQALYGLVCYDNGSSELISSSTGWSRLTDGYGTTRIGHLNNVIYNKADDIRLQSASGTDKLRIRTDFEFEVPSGGAIYMNEGALGIATLASSGNTFHPNTSFNNNAIVNGHLDVRDFIRERIAAKNWVDKTKNYDNLTYTNRVEYLSDATGETTTHKATTHIHEGTFFTWNDGTNDLMKVHAATGQSETLLLRNQTAAVTRIRLLAPDNQYLNFDIGVQGVGNGNERFFDLAGGNFKIYNVGDYYLYGTGNSTYEAALHDWRCFLSGTAETVMSVSETDFVYKAPMNNGTSVIEQDCLTANNTQLSYYISNKTGSGSNNRRYAFRAGSSGTNQINKHIEIGEGAEDVIGQNQIRLNGTGSMIYVSPSVSNVARFTSGILCDSTGATVYFDSSTPSIGAKTSNGITTNAFHPLFFDLNYYDANQHVFRFKDANANFLSGGVSFTAGGNVFVNGGLVHSSDRRIKKNIEELKDDECLDILRKLKPCKYDYIDQSRGTSKVYGFIAQEVKEVLPYAVKKITDVIPNVLGDAVICGDVITLPHSIDLAVGTKIKTDIGTLNPDEYNVVLEKVSSNQYKCSNLKGEKCKVFGTLVDDFHDLNKNAIWTVATSALQELDRKVAQLADHTLTINRLKEENANLKLEVSSLQSKMKVITDVLIKANLL